jgi:FMN-dependent oxidoreductase (nitrilotriacetate monooxygenase family)
MSTASAPKQIILAAYVGGVNEHTLWEHPDAGSQIAFSTFRQVAQTAERGFFDYFFLAEGLALRERDGEVFDHDIAGRPHTLSLLSALAAVTERIGLVGTLNATFNEPYELARQLASLDHLSGGRAGWNVVTSFDEFTGGNFRRGGFLPRSQRYERAAEFLSTARELWDSWAEDAIAADAEGGRFLADPTAGAFARRSDQFDISGRFTVPRSPQGHPVIVQAGVSPQGRDFAAANSDLIFSPFSRLPEAREFYADVKRRAVGFGRDPEHLKIVPSIGYVLGGTEEEARRRALEIQQQVLTEKTVRVRFEQVWNRDLSEYDIDGPVPELEPDESAPSFIQGRAFHLQDRHQAVREWQELAARNGWSLRELAAEVFARPQLVGTPEQVADQLDEFVQQDGADGVVLGGHVTPHGLDDFVDHVVPLLQQRGSLRREYTGSTLRENLGLPVPEAAPARASAVPAAAGR